MCMDTLFYARIVVFLYQKSNHIGLYSHTMSCENEIISTSQGEDKTERQKNTVEQKDREWTFHSSGVNIRSGRGLRVG